MGPRSWDRGERLAGLHQLVPSKPLNGAAVLGPRRVSAPAPAPATTTPFNGAAVLGPRRACVKSCASISSATLQWGRGLGTAERSRIASQDKLSRSFNGAAVLGPRRDVSCYSRESPASLPSMGPRSWDRGERTENRLIDV